MTRKVVQVSTPNQVAPHLSTASLRNKRIGAAIIILVMTVAVLYTVLTPAAPPDTSKMGVHLMLDDGRHVWDQAVWRDHMTHAAMVGNTVTQLVRADNLDPAYWQVFMDLCAEFNLTPVVRLATTYNTENGWWEAPVPDADGRYLTAAQQYADFVSALDWVDGAPHYIIVGNEPNHGDEWGGRPDPAAYARYLIDVAQVIKDVDPDAVILNGALDWYTPHTGSQPFENGQFYMDAETFMDEMVKAEPRVFESLDAWASHAYALSAVWQQTHQVDELNDAANPNRIQPPVYVYNRGVNSYQWEFYKLNSLGFTKTLPVLITETGWRHDQYSAEEVAMFLDLAYAGNNRRYPGQPEVGWGPWFNDANIIAVTPFALNGNPAEWDAFNWLELDADGKITATRPVFDRMATLKTGELTTDARNGVPTEDSP